MFAPTSIRSVSELAAELSTEAAHALTNNDEHFALYRPLRPQRLQIADDASKKERRRFDQLCLFLAIEDGDVGTVHSMLRSFKTNASIVFNGANHRSCRTCEASDLTFEFSETLNSSTTQSSSSLSESDSDDSLEESFSSTSSSLSHQPRDADDQKQPSNFAPAEAELAQKEKRQYPQISLSRGIRSTPLTIIKRTPDFPSSLACYGTSLTPLLKAMALLKNVKHEPLPNGNMFFTVTTSRNDRLTALASIDRRRFEIVRLLLEAGGNVNCDSKRDSRKQMSAPIHLIGSNVDVLKLLIDPPYTADVLRRDWDGRAALHIAAAEGSAECVKVLVEHHCTLMIDAARLVTMAKASEEKKEPTKGARAYSPREFSLDDLVDTESLNPLHCALLESHMEAARCLLNAGASVNSLNPLYEAANCCQNHQNLSESVRTLLLDYGADV